MGKNKQEISIRKSWCKGCSVGQPFFKNYFSTSLDRNEIKRGQRMGRLLDEDNLLKQFRYGDLDSDYDKAWTTTIRRIIKAQPSAHSEVNKNLSDVIDTLVAHVEAEILPMFGDDEMYDQARKTLEEIANDIRVEHGLPVDGRGTGLLDKDGHEIQIGSIIQTPKDADLEEFEK